MLISKGMPVCPFNPLAPGITDDINVNCSGSTCTATSGTHDGFPGYTIQVTGEDGKTTTIYEYDPAKAGKGPWSLWPPAECNVAGGTECDKGTKKSDSKQNSEQDRSK